MHKGFKSKARGDSYAFANVSDNSKAKSSPPLPSNSGVALAELKLRIDPETKKELENIQFPKMNNEMPEISEMFTSLFSGGAPKQPEKEKKTSSSNKQTKKRN